MTVPCVFWACTAYEAVSPFVTAPRFHQQASSLCPERSKTRNRLRMHIRYFLGSRGSLGFWTSVTSQGGYFQF